MKQAEKSKITYDKILNGAIKEFGTKSYETASLNNICSDNNISKGLIYHNFKNKDELYLCCVKLCFDELTSFLNSSKYNSNNFRENIKNLLDMRYQFFKENPYYSNIFFGTVLQSPKHLSAKIKELRNEFDNFNSEQYRKIINSVELRDDVTADEALEYFFMLGEMFNGYFESKAYKNTDLNSLIEDHEIKLSKILDIMIYGIVKEDKKYDTINS